VKGDDSIAGLVAACHRALDELHRLDTAKPVGGSKARGEGLLYRWRSAEAGGPEPRCYLVWVADDICAKEEWASVVGDKNSSRRISGLTTSPTWSVNCSTRPLTPAGMKVLDNSRPAD
jgi:hypothetical protein